MAGVTLSSNFPVKSAAQATKPGGMDGFVTKLDANGAIVFSTYLGGSGSDLPAGIAVEGSSNIYIASSSDSTNFPAVNALQPSLTAFGNAFIVKRAAFAHLRVPGTRISGPYPVRVSLSAVPFGRTASLHTLR